jgi:hypothetical protein
MLHTYHVTYTSCYIFIMSNIHHAPCLSCYILIMSNNYAPCLSCYIKRPYHNKRNSTENHHAAAAALRILTDLTVTPSIHSPVYIAHFITSVFCVKRYAKRVKHLGQAFRCVLFAPQAPPRSQQIKQGHLPRALGNTLGALESLR